MQRLIEAAIAAVIMTLVCLTCFTATVADADEFEAVSEAVDRVEADEAARWECLGMLPQMMADKAAREAQEAAQDVEPQPECAEPEAYYEPDYYDDWYYEQEYYGGGSMQGNPNGLNAYDGVNYYEGRTEKYYSSAVAYHYRTPEWTPDDQGFYRDSDGYYVVAASDMEEGTVFEGSMGECKVYDSGCDYGVTDYYVDGSWC